MTSELERIKILEGKISQVVEYINKLSEENRKFKEQMSELKNEKKKLGEKAKQALKLDESLRKFQEERGLLKEKIEGIISQIDQLGL